MNEEQFQKWKADSRWLFQHLNSLKSDVEKGLDNLAQNVLVCPKENREQYCDQAKILQGQLGTLNAVIEMTHGEVFGEVSE